MTTMIGKIESFDGRYFVVHSPEAPAHLRKLNLLRSQMNGAKIGDTVELEYQTTTRSGLWNVVRVI